MNFPTLYTLHSNGNTVRYWKINVIQDNEGVKIKREYGQMNGKNIINLKLMTDFKSKSSVLEQAIFEAEGEWKEKKEKRGYVTDIKLLSGISSQLSTPTTNDTSTSANTSTGFKKFKIELKTGSKVEPKVEPKVELKSGFKFLPMLANKYMERKKHLKFPCIAQPKLDGVRHTAHKLSPTCMMIRTRSDAECLYFDEIRQALLNLPIDSNVFLDGEFYSHKIPFKTLNGYCNRKKKDGFDLIPKDELHSIQYNIFDCYFINQPNKSFEERYDYLKNIMSNNHSDSLVLVKNYVISNENEINPLHNQFISEGYEGIILRNIKSPYKLKDRSNDLLKLKNFQDTEYIIVSASCPSNGKEEGCIIWELKLQNSDIKFTCRPRDTYESRKQDWIDYEKNPQKYIGQHYTVRYQETYDNGIPRFPTGVGICYDH